MKRIIHVVALMTVMIAALCVHAFAIDLSGLVSVASNEYYEESSNMFVLTRSELNGGVVRSSVADGMVTTEAVKIVADTALNLKLYTSGIELSNVNYENISDPGSYTLVASAGGDINYNICNFTIIRSSSGELTGYTMPSGFVITGVTLDGEKYGSSTGGVNFETEGNYCVDYVCYATGIPYNLTFKYDGTAPVLALEGVDENGEARGPVSLADIEDGASLYVYLDGEQITLPANKELTSSGSYRVLAIDKAGNKAEYNFEIGVYFNVNSIIFFMSFFVLVVALLIYLYRARKKMKIR